MRMKKNRKPVSFLSLLLCLLMCLSLCLTVTVAAAGTGTETSAEVTVEEENDDDGGGFLSALLDPAQLIETFKTLFTTTINDWLSGIVNSAFALIDGLMIDLLSGTFHVEYLINSGSNTVLSTDMLHNVYTFLYVLACSLVALKFLFKGFQIYILWRNGDADSSPRDMLTGVAEAAFVMVSFPYLYDKCVDVVVWAAQEIMGRLGIMQYSGGLAGIITATILDWGELFITLAFALLFFVFVLILWIKMVAQGFELLVLRMGVPVATLGLIDSDMALFKNYMQVFIKTGITVVIQVCLMSLSFRVLGTFRFFNLLAAIALVIAALSTPKLLQQFLVPQGGGGGVAQKAYSVAMVTRAAKMLFV